METPEPKRADAPPEIVYIDGIPYPLGRRGDLSAWLLWYGGGLLLAVLALGLLGWLGLWLVSL